MDSTQYKYKNFGDRDRNGSTAMTETSEGNNSPTSSGYNNHKSSKTSSSYHTTGSFSFNSYVTNTNNSNNPSHQNGSRQQPPPYSSSADGIGALESRDEEDATTFSTTDNLQIYSQTSNNFREAEEVIASLYDMISYNGSKVLASQNSTTTTTTDDDEDGTASDTALVGRSYSSYEDFEVRTTNQYPRSRLHPAHPSIQPPNKWNVPPFN